MITCGKACVSGPEFGVTAGYPTFAGLMSPVIVTLRQRTGTRDSGEGSCKPLPVRWPREPEWEKVAGLISMAESCHRVWRYGEPPELLEAHRSRCLGGAVRL